MLSIRKSIYLLTIITFLAMSAFTAAQESHHYTSKKINEHFYIISTGAPTQLTQMGVVIGESGILLIDTWIEGQGKHLLKAIQQISDKPIKYVINTHSHSDHTGGNAFFAELGATIISQQNTQYTNAYGQLYFENTIDLMLGSEDIRAVHVVSHTFDSVLIHLSNSNTIFMGDNFATHGFLSVGENGLEGQLEVIDLALSLADDSTLIIPSHAATDVDGKTIVSKHQLINYRSHVINVIARLKTLYEKGHSIEHMKKDKELTRLTQKFIAGNASQKAVEASINWWLEKGIELELNAKESLTQNELAAFVGVYGDNASKMEVFQQNGKLFIRAKGRLMAELVKIGKRHFDLKGFFFEKNNESLKFETNSSGAVESLQLILGKDSHKGEGRNVVFTKR